MTAIAPTICQVESPLSGVYSGTAERRLVRVYIEATSTGTSDTTNIATYVPEAAAIMGVIWEEVAGAASATKNTWSGTTLTYAGHAGSGVWAMEVMCRTA